MFHDDGCDFCRKHRERVARSTALVVIDEEEKELNWFYLFLRFWHLLIVRFLGLFRRREKYEYRQDVPPRIE